MHKRRKFSFSERVFIQQRANGCCEYCLTRYDFTPETFAIEHVIPLILGGTNELINLAFSCSGCNTRKGFRILAIDPLTRTTVPLYNPRLDNWSDHFIWQDNFLTIEGITEKGRACETLLQINRNGIVNLRRALLAIGEHPPQT